MGYDSTNLIESLQQIKNIFALHMGSLHLLEYNKMN